MSSMPGTKLSTATESANWCPDWCVTVHSADPPGVWRCRSGEVEVSNTIGETITVSTELYSDDQGENVDSVLINGVPFDIYQAQRVEAAVAASRRMIEASETARP